MGNEDNNIPIYDFVLEKIFIETMYNRFSLSTKKRINNNKNNNNYSNEFDDSETNKQKHFDD